MKYLYVLITTVLLLSAVGCASQSVFQDPFTRPQIDWRPGLVLSIGEAERILGSQGHLEKDTAYLDNGTKAYQSAFYDDSPDPATGKTGTLYFMYEEYQTADAASSFLESTLKANNIDPTEGVLKDGDARIYYLAGGKVVRMAMILKGNRLIRLKVNRVTSHYRVDEFQKVAGELAERL